jgi:hypothetical protein
MVQTVGYAPMPPSPNTAEVIISTFAFSEWFQIFATNGSSDKKIFSSFQNGGRYSTFEVTISSKSKRQQVLASSSSRRFAFVGGSIAIALAVALVMSSDSRTNKLVINHQGAISEAIKMSMEEEVPIGISEHRAKFLESLEEQFPESMRQNMNFSMDPCR